MSLGARLLLDTHALLWWAFDDRRLSPDARAALYAKPSSVFVSAASVWEIATKARLGKLPEGERLLARLAAYLVEQGFTGLDITVDHALRAGLLPGPHKDPFDRLLIAQAQAENLALVSNEAVFDRYGVVRVW